MIALVLGLAALQDGNGDERTLERREAAEAEEPLRPGPLGVRGHSLFQVATVDFTPDAPLYLDAGSFELHTSITWLNVFNYVENAYVIDGEFARASVTAWYGLTDRWQIGATLPIEYIGGGLLDTFIEGFHDAFRLDQGGREEFEEGKFQVGTSNGRGGFDWRSSKTSASIGDIVLASRYRILDPTETAPGVSVGFRMKVPTAARTDFYESHGIGLGLDMNVFYPFGDWLLYGGFSAAMVGETEVLGQSLEKMQYALLLAVERRISPDLSIVAQLLAQSPLARHFHEFSDWSTEVSLGMKVRLHPHLTLQIAAIENLFNFDNSPDLGFHLGFVIRP